jgi:precorrin-6B methylase 1
VRKLLISKSVIILARDSGKSGHMGIADSLKIGEFEFHECPVEVLEQRSVDEERRVSTTLRHMLTEFSEFFHVSWTGLLIHASVGTAGGLGALRTKRSG